jgi:hypothetical protein
MYAMQYEITLPADYDLGIIGAGWEANRHRLDDFPGLGLKAYLLRDTADGSVVNQYAPLYLWNDPRAIGRFLWGGAGFGGICASFGRPVVRQWTALRRSPARTTIGRRSARPDGRNCCPADEDPAPAVAAAVDLLGKTARSPGVHSAAVAVDPTRWELMQLTLWSTPAPAVRASATRCCTCPHPG